MRTAGRFHHSKLSLAENTAGGLGERERDGQIVGARHRQYKHPNKPGTVTVAGKPSLDVPPGTLNAILKQAGLKKEK
jgi:hypothetical protein